MAPLATMTPTGSVPVGSRHDLRVNNSPDAPDESDVRDEEGASGYVHSYETSSRYEGTVFESDTFRVAVEGTFRAGGSDRQVADGRAKVNISSVSKMYRRLNLRAAIPGGKADGEESLGNPENWPDAEHGSPGHVVLDGHEVDHRSHRADQRRLD